MTPKQLGIVLAVALLAIIVSVVNIALILYSAATRP